MKKIKFWQLIAVLLGTALVAAIAVAVTLFVGRSSNETELPEVDNMFAEIESSEQQETNFAEESTSELISSEPQPESSIEDEQSSAVEEESDLDYTIYPEEPSEIVTQPSHSQTTNRPSQTKPEQSQVTTQSSQEQTTQTKPEQSQLTNQPNKPEAKQEFVGLAIKQMPGGSATANGVESIVIEKGMAVTLFAELEEGYEFDEWRANGVPYSKMNPAQIIPQEQNTGILPIYKKVIPPSKDNGSNGNSAGNNGNGGSNGGNSSSDDKPQQKPNNKKSYTVKVEQAEGGSATANGKTKVTVQSGKNVALKAKPDKYHYFDGWQIGSKLISKENPYNYKVTGNVTIKPIYKEIYRLRVAVENKGGTLKVTEDDEILLKEIRNYQYADICEGRRISVVATLFEGYALKGWIVDGKEISSKSNTYSFTATADCDVVAVFEEKEPEEKYFKVSVSKTGAGNGTVTIDGKEVSSKEVTEGSEVTFNTTPDKGSTFEEYIVNGRHVSENPCTVKITENLNVVIVIEKAPAEQEMKTLTITTEGSGYILLDNVRKNKVTLPKGTTVEAEAMEREGFKFDSWSDGVKTNPRKITLNTDINLGAKFVKTSSKPEDTATVTLVVKSGKGTVAMNGKTGTRWTAEKGTEVSFTQKPAKGYLFGGWGEDKDMSETYKIVVNDDMEIPVYFDETVEIKLSAQEGGSLTFDGQTVTTEETFVVRKGTEEPLKANPEKDYKFSGYTGDTQYLEGTGDTVVLKAEADIELTAKFEKRTEYTLTLRMEGGDATVTLDGKTVDFVDGTATLKVTASRYELETTPKSGYRFGSYKNAHGVVITTSPKRTITIANDTEITVELVNEVQREVVYKVRGSIFYTDYVEPGKAPEKFYSEGMDNLGDDVFKGWNLKNEDKFFEGVAGSADFVNSETKENLSDAIKRITQSSDVTLEASLQAKEVYCTLSIEDSMELVGPHDTKEIDGVVCYRKGSSISLKIKAGYSNPDKPYFSHWEVSGIGKAGMNPEELIFTLHGDTAVTAVWSSVEVDKEPVVTMTTGDIIPDKGIANVRVDYEVPGGYSVNQVGIQMSVNGGEMEEKVSKNPSNPNATSGFQGWAGLLMEDQMKEGAVVKLRPYIILVGNGSEDYAYGAIAEFDFSAYKAEEEDEDVQLLSEEVEQTEEVSEEETTSEETSEEDDSETEETSEEDDSETEETSETTDTATEENSEAVESTTEETTETSEPDSTPVTTEEETEPESSITVETSEPVADSSESEETVEEEDSSTEEESEEQSEPEDGNTETVNIEAIVKEDDN